MRKAVSKFHWQGRGALVALALMVGILGLLLLNSGVKAAPPPFNVEVSTDVSDDAALANADILSTFSVGDNPWPAAMYDVQISFTPPDWGVPESADIPIGAVVGKLITDATLGWFNNPCDAAYGGSLHIEFDPLLNCSIDTSDTIAFSSALGSPFFADSDANGLPDGCDKYPEHLVTMFPGMTPRTRHAGFEFIGINVTLSFMTFKPGTSIPSAAAPGVPPFSADKGYVAMSVLNDPTAPLVKNQITDLCPPLGTNTTYYGLSQDNPATAGENEAGYPWRTNPAESGAYTFYGYARSVRDADGDNIDNELDTCPHILNEGDPKVKYSGDPDNDGLDSACDPTPDTAAIDPDGDGFPNRQDNCPLVANGLTDDDPSWDDQADTDYDGIGDACDVDDWNGDGDTVDDPGEPTGFSPTTPNGEYKDQWFASDIQIGEAEDSDNDGFPDTVEEELGSDPDDADSTPEHVDEAGTCTDDEDNDLDGYIDEIDGGCEDDSDEDGISDEGEEQLGSDPDDADSTPEDASIAGTCDDGVDNDLDGDIDAEDDGCVVPETPTPTPEEGTPTPTPEEGTPTPTPEEGTPTPTVEVDICEPVFPGLYNGRVLLDGSPAAAGWEVTAWVGGVEWASAIVSGGRYAMDIPDRLAVDTCFEPGTITFKLDGMTCEPSPEWAAGLQDDVDLTCVSAEVTPTPEEPTPTPPVEPTPTPTVLPPTGMGGMSGDGSFMWWPLALAAAALTSAASLGALAAAKRR